MEQTENVVQLCGTLAELPRYSHENHDRQFYSFPLEVRRLSGTVDRLPVLVPEQVLSRMEIDDGSMVAVTGQIRTHNHKTEDGRRLLVSVYAESLRVCQEEDCNQVLLRGRICREPVYRRTPLGREICDVMLAVNRAYRRADYIPCIFWGRTAAMIRTCTVGDRLRVEGRMQSRTYVKILEQESQQRTAYEVSAMEAEIL